MQPKLEAAGIREGVAYRKEQIAAALGEQLLIHLERLTDDATTHIDRTIESTTKVVNDVWGAMKRRYPDNRILYLGDADTPAE